MKRRNRQSDGHGQATTMSANDTSSGIRIDRPHLLASDMPSLAASEAEDGVDPAAIDADDLVLLPLEARDQPAPNEAHEDVPAMLVNPASPAAGLKVVHDNPADVVSPASASLPVGVFSPEALLSPLEERVRKLEAALAELRDTRQLESRVAARVSDQIAQDLCPRPVFLPRRAWLSWANVSWVWRHRRRRERLGRVPRASGRAGCCWRCSPRRGRFRACTSIRAIA